MPDQEPSPQQKFNFLSKVYFGTSDNPVDDVNPFDNLNDFLDALVSSMNWGQSPDVVQRSKIRFAYNFSKVLEQYKVQLAQNDILDALQNDKQNKNAVNAWVSKAVFINY